MSSSRRHLNEDFAVFVKENTDMFVGFGRYICGDLGEDMAMQAVIRMYEAWPNPELRQKITSSSSYVFRIIKNSYLDFRKNRSRTSELESELFGDDSGGFSDGNVGSSDELDSAMDIRSAIRQLNDEEREIVFWRYYFGLQLKEASKKMGIAQDAGYRLHHSALENLRTILNKSEGEE